MVGNGGIRTAAANVVVLPFSAVDIILLLKN